jgi:hypothetical protein
LGTFQFDYVLKVNLALQWSPCTFEKLQLGPSSSTSSPLLCFPLCPIPLPSPAMCRALAAPRRPSRHARRQSCPQLLHLRRAPLSLKARPRVPLDFFSTLHCAALPRSPSSARLLSPEPHRCLGSPSTAASAASHPRSSALAAPPQPTEAHRPAQFRSPAPN